MGGRGEGSARRVMPCTNIPQVSTAQSIKLSICKSEYGILREYPVMSTNCFGVHTTSIVVYPCVQ